MCRSPRCSASGWRAHGVRPHRLQRHMVSNDPDFEAKAADVISLYLNPPAHAAVFCVDEKTAVQALDRKDRTLPLSPGRALNIDIGEVLGRPALRHTSEQFAAFLTDVVSAQDQGREIHVICDNAEQHGDRRTVVEAAG